MSKETTSEVLTRTLIYIPIIHSQVEMGAFSESVRKATLQKLGRQAWNRKVRLIDKTWEAIERTVDGLKLPNGKILLYQDGLPVCGREAEIVADLARAGSRNHRLLIRLMERGPQSWERNLPAFLLKNMSSTSRPLPKAGIQNRREWKHAKRPWGNPCLRSGINLSPTVSTEPSALGKRGSFSWGCSIP